MQNFRPGLGTRISITMLVALILMQVSTAMLFFLLPRPQATVYSARWLIARVGQAATILGTDVAQQKKLARDLGAKTRLNIIWQDRNQSPPPDDNQLAPSLLRLKSSLRPTVGGAVTSVYVVEMEGLLRGPPEDELQFVPSDFDQKLLTGPLLANEPDIPVFGIFRIIVNGTDGSSISIEPPPPKLTLPFFSPPVVAGVIAIFLASVLSAWTAKRALAPIDHLVTAAGRLGVERSARPIDTQGLGDFTVIGDAINGMQARIKGFIDERSQILAAISHDLRTSLTRLRLTAEELPDGPEKDSVIRHVDDMERMLAATLTFAGDDLKNERSERVDLAALLITVCDSFADVGAHVDYKGPDHLYTMCQPTAVKRTFVNVIDNAVKYGGGAEVELAASNEAIRVTVLDRGPGIPRDFVAQAFRPFTRLEQSRNRETGGAGLGLTIAKDILSAHGGTIRLDPRSGGGLEVAMHLPVRSSS